jgi:amino acid transporter
MNEIMKTLTMISTVMLPLTFIAGLYGMNFKHMPELSWKYGYPFALLLMLFIALGIFWFFKRKHWIGADDIQVLEEETARRKLKDPAKAAAAADAAKVKSEKAAG